MSFVVFISFCHYTLRLSLSLLRATKSFVNCRILCVTLPVCLSLCLDLFHWLCLFASLPMYTSVSVSTSLWFYISLDVCVCLSVCVCLCLCPSPVYSPPKSGCSDLLSLPPLSPHVLLYLVSQSHLSCSRWRETNPALLRPISTDVSQRLPMEDRKWILVHTWHGEYTYGYVYVQTRIHGTRIHYVHTHAHCH